MPIFFFFQVRGLDICALAKDFKSKTANSRTTALFFEEEIYSTLIDIVGDLGINTSNNPRQLNLANQITKFVETNCQEKCCFEMQLLKPFAKISNQNAT